LSPYPQKAHTKVTSQKGRKSSQIFKLKCTVTLAELIAGLLLAVLGYMRSPAHNASTLQKKPRRFCGEMELTITKTKENKKGD